VGYRQNLAEALRLAKETSDLSLTAFAEELEISRSQLLEFLKERGNPRVETILHIAAKLEIDPAALFESPFRSKPHPALELIFQGRTVLRLVAPQNRQAFLDHFTQMLTLLEVNNENRDS